MCRVRVSGVVVSAWLVFGGVGWGRAVEARWAIDVRAAAETAPVVFRGRVTQVKPVGEVSQYHLDAVARFEPDRWSRGERPAEVWVHFVYDAFRPFNHYCENLEPGSDWVIFASAVRGQLELMRDCNGVLPVSAHIGAVMRSGDYLSQMQADFAAGRNDAELSKRIRSLWWLGGLKMPSSRGVIQRWVDGSGGVERHWALFALARSDGAASYPGTWVNEQPDVSLCDLWHYGDARYWAERVKTAKGEWGLGCAMRGLGEMKARSGLDAIAMRLGDARTSVRWDALAAMREITGAEACAASLSRAQARKCAEWWKDAGHGEPPRLKLP